MELNEKVAIVTGGASGLGKSIVEMLIDNGSKVVVLDINEDALNSMSSNKNILCIKCDLTNPEEIEKTIIKIRENFSQVQILVNNAGVLYSEPLINIFAKEKRHKISSWQKVMDINLTAPFIVGSFVSEHMIMNKIKGVIINVSSVSARGNIGQSAYSAAKAGLESLTKVWAKELGGFGIRAVAIAPGFMDTDSTRAAVNSEILENIKNKVPLKKLGNVKDVSHAVKFIIENEYLNGCVLNVDGGLVI